MWYGVFAVMTFAFHAKDSGVLRGEAQLLTAALRREGVLPQAIRLQSGSPLINVSPLGRDSSA
jgi:hypothetical protein